MENDENAKKKTWRVVLLMAFFAVVFFILLAYVVKITNTAEAPKAATVATSSTPVRLLCQAGQCVETDMVTLQSVCSTNTDKITVCQQCAIAKNGEVACGTFFVTTKK